MMVTTAILIPFFKEPYTIGTRVLINILWYLVRTKKKKKKKKKKKTENKIIPSGLCVHEQFQQH